ncbi:flagellar basal body P-ring formation chaperone FlgA [Microvirga thermotolerans]|uniref:Flagella basal body P-ring formation protein FlgA n=1 Tax=Microvirga thermotolerans TaxID=2651334 RepID=A0A5P9JZ12_9HYPH|nr:flagellar basal body P-ring formation chaperone FlgA [Microvirga thermotolerans]QFU17683.1 flagellar basal body P-ring formation protein FlgA [Microvirga thermotolerans]
MNLLLRLLIVCTLIGFATTARADEILLPVPAVTIYPGDTIKESMLKERSFLSTFRARSAVIESPVQLIGKVARRTLLPGEAIPTNAVDDARLVSRGVATQIIFQENGLTISALGSPLQSGSLGELIRVRNVDTGRIVLGTVQADGTIRIGGY